MCKLKRTQMYKIYNLVTESYSSNLSILFFIAVFFNNFAWEKNIKLIWIERNYGMFHNTEEIPL